jgi:uncharacterized membrane protein YeaQ/YmgE (transglycosylase-associated protein family)
LNVTTISFSIPLKTRKATPRISKQAISSQEVRRRHMAILWWVIVGLVAGWLTGKIMKGSGYGVLMDIVIGIVGALVGGFIMQALGFAGSGGLIYTIAVAVLGAVVLTVVVRALKRA